MNTPMHDSAPTTATAAHAVDDDEINLLEYWHILRQRQWLIVAITGAVAALALVGTLLMTPIFRAGATLQIERDSMKIVDVGALTPAESPNDRDFYQTQYELLKSRSLALRVVQDLKLTGNPAYAGVIEAVDEKLADDAATDAGRKTAASPQQVREHALVAPVLDALSIEPIRNSRLVNVNFDSPDPQLAARVANAWSDAYIASNLERRFDASSYARKYLEERLAQLKARLEDSEKELVAFSTREQIVSVGDDKPSLSAQSLSELNTALAVAENTRTRTEAMWQQANGKEALGLPQVVANPLIQKLREQRAVLVSSYQEKLGTFKPDYPDMVRLKGQIDEADRQIRAEVGYIRSSVNAEYQAAADQEALLRTRIEQLKGNVLDLQGRSIQLNILKREAETNRQLYEALLQRYKEIGVAGNVGTNNISVVDRAEAPAAPHSPRLALNLAIGLLLGGFLGVLAAFLLHHLDHRVRSSGALAALTHRPVLGVVPLLPAGQSPTQAATDLRSAFSEAYRSVRTALQFATSDGLPRSLFITSATAGEGKTTTAAELASNIALLGKRVVLVDGDLRNPSIHRALGLGNATGLSTLLAGGATLADALQASGRDNLSVLTAGPLPPNPPELLAGDRLPQLLAELQARCDVVIIDGPPVLGLADAPLLAHQAQSTLLVVSADEGRRDALLSALHRLDAARASVTGLLLTRFDPRHKSEGYGYNYYQYGGSGD